MAHKTDRGKTIMVRDYFNDKAESWDSYASERNHSKLEKMIKRLELNPGNTVLDVGTGTGVFLPYLIGKVRTNGQVIALDIAEKMLLQARNKGFSGKISFLCANVEHIPLKSETCDAAVCYSSFPHFQNKVKSLREIQRVLKTDGRIFICHTSSRNHINQIHMNIPTLHCDTLPDHQEMQRLMQTAGFNDIQVEDEEESYFARGRKP